MLTNRTPVTVPQIYPNIERINTVNVLNYKNDQISSRIMQFIVDLAVIIIIFIIFIFVYFFVDPKIRYMTCADSDIVFPYIANTVPFYAVGLFATIGPLLTILIVELLNLKILSCEARTSRRTCRTYLICVFHAISLFALGVGITLLLTEIGKRWAGRLRPHFLAVCLPDYSQINCASVGLNGFLFNSVSTGGSFCTGDAAQIKEARLSFPSGHASYSWYGMVFLIIYVQARLILLRFRYFKPLLQMTAFIAAFVTSLSRIIDYHHRGSDVIGGSILGKF